MIVVVKFTLHCFSYLIILNWSTDLVNAKKVFEINRPLERSHILYLARKSDNELFNRIKWDKVRRGRIFLHKREDNKDNNDKIPLKHNYKSASYKKSYATHKALSEKENNFPLTDEEDSLSDKNVLWTKRYENAYDDLETSRVPIHLKEELRSWNGKTGIHTRYSDYVSKSSLDDLRNNRKDRITSAQVRQRLQNRLNKASNKKSRYIRTHSVRKKNLADDEDNYKDSSGDIPDDTNLEESSGETESNEDGKNIHEKRIFTEIKNKYVNDSEESEDEGSTQEMQQRTSREHENSLNIEYEKVKQTSAFSPKSFSDMIVEDITKNKGDSPKVPNLVAVAQSPVTQPSIRFETVQQPVTAQRILPFLGNRQTTKNFKTTQIFSKTFPKVVRPRHYHSHHHSHYYNTLDNKYEKKSTASLNINVGRVNSNSAKKRQLGFNTAQSIMMTYPILSATNRRLIPARAGPPMQPPPILAPSPNISPAQIRADPGYIPARLSDKPFMPPPKPTIYDKILKSVAKMGEKAGIKASSPLDTNKATAFLNSYYRHVKELSSDSSVPPTNATLAESGAIGYNGEAMSNGAIEQLENNTQSKQDIPLNSIMNNTGYGTNIAPAYSSYSHGVPVPMYSPNILGHNQAVPPDRRSISLNTFNDSKRTLLSKQSLLKCYNEHCEKRHKYTDVKGSKKDVLIGKLISPFDREDIEKGDFDVAEINGAQLIEDTGDGGDVGDNTDESDEENGEELRRNLKQSQPDVDEEADNVSVQTDDSHLLGTNSEASDTSGIISRRLTVSQGIPHPPVVNEVELQHVEEAAGGSLIPYPQDSERKSHVMESTKNVNQIEEAKYPIQMKSKYVKSITKPEQIEGEKYIDVDELGRRRKSDTGVPLGEIEIDNPNIPNSNSIENSPLANSVTSIDELRSPHNVDITQFSNKESDIQVVQDIDNKEFQGYIQSIKNKEAAKDRDFEEYVQSFRDREGGNARAAKKDKYTGPQSIAFNEYRQEKTHDGNYGVAVAPSVPFKVIQSSEVAENYPQKMSRNYRGSHILPVVDVEHQMKKTINYDFAKEPAINEYTMNSEESNHYAIAHSKKNNFGTSSYNPSQSENIEKIIPSPSYRKYTSVDHGLTKGGTPFNYEFSKETEPLSQVSNAELSPSHHEKHTIEYGPANEGIPRVKEANHVRQDEIREGQYDYLADTDNSANPARRTVNAYTHEETVENPYTEQNSETEKLNYGAKQYTPIRRTSYGISNPSSYVTSDRYGNVPSTFPKKIHRRRTSTSETLMKMTHNPNMFSTTSIYMKPVVHALHAKPSVVENVDLDSTEKDNENIEVSKLIKGQIQDPTSFEQNSFNERKEQRGKARYDESPVYTVNYGKSQMRRSWSGNIYADSKKPLRIEYNRNEGERDENARQYMNFGKRTVDENSELSSTNEVKNLIPVMKSKRLANISLEGKKRMNENLILSENKAQCNETSITQLSGDDVLPVTKKRRFIIGRGTANATKKMEVPDFSDLGSTRNIDHDESANLLSGVDTPLPIRTKDDVKSVAGETKNIISTTEEPIPEIKTRLLRKLALKKEDTLAEKTLSKDELSEQQISKFIHKDSPGTDEGDHAEKQDWKTTERKSTPMVVQKQDNEMNIVDEEDINDTKRTNGKTARVADDVGEDIKLEDIIAHAKKMHPDASPNKLTARTKNYKDEDIKENETVLKTGAAVLTADPYKSNEIKEHARRKESQGLQLEETEEKIYPMVVENDQSEFTDNKKNKGDESRYQNNVQRKQKQNREEASEKVIENGEKDESLSFLKGENKKSQNYEKVRLKLTSGNEDNHEKSHVKESEYNEAVATHVKEPNNIKHVQRTSENTQFKLNSKSSQMERDQSSSENAQLEEDKIKELTRKEWQKNYEDEKSNEFVQKEGKKYTEEKFDEKQSNRQQKVKEVLEGNDSASREQLEGEKQKVFDNKNRKENGNANVQNELDKIKLKDSSNDHAPNEMNGYKKKNKKNEEGYDMSNKEIHGTKKQDKKDSDEITETGMEKKKKNDGNAENNKSDNNEMGKSFDKESLNNTDNNKHNNKEPNSNVKYRKESRQENENSEPNIYDEKSQHSKERGNEEENKLNALSKNPTPKKANEDELHQLPGKKQSEELNTNIANEDDTKPMKPDDKNDNDTRSKELDYKAPSPGTIESGDIYAKLTDKTQERTETGYRSNEKPQPDQDHVEPVTEGKESEITEAQIGRNLADPKEIGLTTQDIKKDKEEKMIKHKNPSQKESDELETSNISSEETEKESETNSRKKLTEEATSEDLPVPDSNERNDKIREPTSRNGKEPQSKSTPSQRTKAYNQILSEKGLDKLKETGAPEEIDRMVKTEKEIEKMTERNAEKMGKDGENQNEKKTEKVREKESEKDARKELAKANGSKTSESGKHFQTNEFREESNERPMNYHNNVQYEEGGEEQLNKEVFQKYNESKGSEFMEEKEKKQLNDDETIKEKTMESIKNIDKDRSKDMLEAPDSTHIETKESKYGEKIQDPEEKKLKELLNKKVEEIMERFRKEKESGVKWPGNDSSNINGTSSGESPPIQEVGHYTKTSEEREKSEQTETFRSNSAFTGDKSSTDVIVDNYDKPNEEKIDTTAEYTTYLKDDVDKYHNSTVPASTKNVIEGMPNPFADIGSIPDGPAYNTKTGNYANVSESKDINEELAEIMSHKGNAETVLHEKNSKTQRASARDLLPKAIHPFGDNSNNKVSKRGFYRYLDVKRRNF